MVQVLLALVAACSISSARGTDDAQVLVQVHSPKVHDPVIVTPTEPRVCSAAELASHSQDVQAALKAQQDSVKNTAEKNSNASRGIVEMHMAPLRNATEQIFALLQKAMRPAVVKIMTFGLQKVSKPKKPYPPAALVDLNQTLKELEQLLGGVAEPAKAIFLAGLEEADALLNQSADALPDEVKKVFRNHGLPQNETQAVEYFTDKVLPVVLLEMFPKLAKPVELMTKMPKRPEEILAFAMSEVIPWAMHELPNMLPEPVTLPKRDCITCQDQYQRQAMDLFSGCTVHCSTLLSSCKQGANQTCLQQFGPCLTCHRKSLAQLDECEGKSEHNSTIAKLQSLGDILGDGSFSQGYDKFLDELSALILS